MKPVLKYFTFFFLFTTLELAACDVCGCASGTNYMGVLPQFNKNLIGIRFGYGNSIHPVSNFNTNDLTSQVLEDQFYTSELRLRYFLEDRWQLFVNVPYAVHQRLETQRTTTIEGIGDINLNLNYTLIDYGDSISSDWKNLLLLGGGVELPTGMYQQRDDTKLMLPALFQIGSGAFQYNLNLIHTIRYRTWGLNTNLRYTYRGENELKYDYGNQVSGALALFYWAETKKMAFLPSIGISVDHFEKDYQYDVLKPYTGGTLTNFTAALDVYINRFMLQAFVQVPVSQNIPSSQPSSNFNVGAGLSVFLGKRN